jgi:LPS-assembly protein
MTRGRTTLPVGSRVWLPVAAALLVLLVVPPSVSAAQARFVAPAGFIELRAQQQRRVGTMLDADGDVEVRYGEMLLRADHVAYDTRTRLLTARGRIEFTYRTTLLRATRASYNLATGRGTFEDVDGTLRAEREPTPALLVSPNPLVFHAERVERLDETTYRIDRAWVTVCRPDRPKWKFHTARALLKLDRSVHMVHATFELFSIPVIWLPYASAPSGRHLRQSGFLIPDIGQSSRKGFVLGDSYYWAPTGWMDATLGAQVFSRRGWSQIGELRARPSEKISFNASYFGVDDRGLPGPNGVRQPQGGYEAHQQFDAFLPQGWRAVLDLTQLTSLTFRLAFAETFAQAVNPEVSSVAFLTNDFRGFSLNFAAINYKNFLNISPPQSVVMRRAPEVRFGSVDQAPWKRWPVYFGFDVFADAVHRDQTGGATEIETPAMVQRFEVAPRVTMPLRWGPWLGVTPTFVVRSTHDGAQQLPDGAILPESLRRTTEELTVDLRPPSFDRIWGDGSSRWKHVIEPEVVYRLVRGVNDFGKFIRFDQDETIADTNEFEYSLTQRLYHRTGSGTSEFLSWRVAQKYYFDPTFDGALVPGRRNVFDAVDSLTPFAFADTPRHFSPVVSDLRVMPGGPYDVQFLVNYDTVRSKPTLFGTLVKLHGYRHTFLTLAHFSVNSASVLEPRSDQLQALVGYGALNRRGWNASFGFSYDAHHQSFQNQIVQVSYNGSCCGIAFEYRRLVLGPVRTENQFRVALLIANVGTFGNVHRREKIF